MHESNPAHLFYSLSLCRRGFGRARLRSRAQTRQCSAERKSEEKAIVFQNPWYPGLSDATSRYADPWVVVHLHAVPFLFVAEPRS
jgi:hypothetical protein